MGTSYVSEAGAVVAGRGRGRLWMALFGAMIAAVAGFGLMGSGGGTTTVPGAATTPSTLSKEAAATVPEALAPYYESGWLPYDGDDVLRPEAKGEAKRKGYVHYGENAAPGKAPIYDAPEGKIVGYAYAQLGFVSLADDPGFDASALRVERFGCDGFRDPTCKPTGLDVQER